MSMTTPPRAKTTQKDSRQPSRLGVGHGRQRSRRRQDDGRLLTFDSANEVPRVFDEDVGSVHAKESLGRVFASDFGVENHVRASGVHVDEFRQVLCEG